MNIRISDLVNDSIVDGLGLRLAIFTQGCPHHCPGCHNPHTHDPQGGRETTTEHILAVIAENPLLDGITLTGGDPFMQPLECASLAEGVKKIGLNVWTYTGYTFEQLIASENLSFKRLLNATDVLIDGPFRLDERSLEIPFRGSRNQRIIDVKKSLETGNVVEFIV